MSHDLLGWRKVSSVEEWQRLADLSCTSPGYLNLIAYGHRKASPALAKRIEVATSGAVTKEQLRPDIYGD
ncbi:MULTISPECIES: transcriptional regulator [Yersinia]|uniref:Uncharacterized protein conserved in bacteria, prophage-related n=2 Tax=Yersinia TaxID=629 RepID=A0A0T9RPZ3_9GAMM|nr:MULTISPECIES: YdaS family helix-turn-helix protein [Yersinia]ATX62785.1 transcriptional regulator [Yersinia hibernica]CNI74051.1 Uncharacterized protein conserved in bacteria%2C prophage-related [Yersinia pekkanenii]CRY69723.1 Uncharacterized protein conserved in bacteria%2C prophage-related [Yersinia pekkanenii]HEG0620372.1 helix-turn-helix domain-containing protein [Yersinia enterocolitica]